MAISKIKTVSIEDNAITTGKILNDAVTAGKIVDGAVVADIADDSITGGKFANDIAISTTGNIVTTGSGSITSAGSLTVGGATIFNEAGADVDFRIESNNEQNMFLVDGGNDAVILGHSTKVNGINDDNEGVKGSGGQLQLHGATPVIDIFSYSTTDGTHGGINFMKSASDTVGTGAVVSQSDIVGSIQFGGYDGVDYASIAGKIDFQMGGEGIAENDTAGEIVFYTTPDGQGGTGSTERMRLHSTGVVSVPSGNFKASNGSTAQYYNAGGNANSGNWHEFNSAVGNEQILALTCHHTGTDNEGLVIRHVSDTNNTNSGFISCANDINGTKFAVKGNGNVQSATDSYGSTSDERLKSDIKDAKSQWDDIKQLKFRNFKKYDTKDLVHLGLVAQEAEKISPNLIYTAKPTALDIKHDSTFGTLYEDGDTIPDGKKVGDVKEIKEQVKYIKSSVLYMKAVKALQEAMARIETLESKVKTLEET